MLRASLCPGDPQPGCSRIVLPTHGCQGVKVFTVRVEVKDPFAGNQGCGLTASGLPTWMMSPAFFSVRPSSPGLPVLPEQRWAQAAVPKPQPGKYVCSQSWRLDNRGRGGSRVAPSQAPLLGGQTAVSSLRCRPPVHVCVPIFSYKDTGHVGFVSPPPPQSPHFNLNHLSKDPFPNPGTPWCWGSGLACVCLGDTIQPATGPAAVQCGTRAGWALSPWVCIRSGAPMSSCLLGPGCGLSCTRSFPVPTLRPRVPLHPARGLFQRC